LRGDWLAVVAPSRDTADWFLGGHSVSASARSTRLPPLEQATHPTGARPAPELPACQTIFGPQTVTARHGYRAVALGRAVRRGTRFINNKAPPVAMKNQQPDRTNHPLQY